MIVRAASPCGCRGSRPVPKCVRRRDPVHASAVLPPDSATMDRLPPIRQFRSPVRRGVGDVSGPLRIRHRDGPLNRRPLRCKREGWHPVLHSGGSASGCWRFFGCRPELWDRRCCGSRWPNCFRNIPEVPCRGPWIWWFRSCPPHCADCRLHSAAAGCGGLAVGVRHGFRELLWAWFPCLPLWRRGCLDRLRLRLFQWCSACRSGWPRGGSRAGTDFIEAGTGPRVKAGAKPALVRWIWPAAHRGAPNAGGRPAAEGIPPPLRPNVRGIALTGARATRIRR